MKKIKVIISGQVQGVFFRAHTKQKADELGIKGWVRNKADGRVEAVFAGPKDKVRAMVSWCWQGSPGSKVEKVEKVEKGRPFDSAQGEGFEIRY
jgi:acylphosphatase